MWECSFLSVRIHKVSKYGNLIKSTPFWKPYLITLDPDLAIYVCFNVFWSTFKANRTVNNKKMKKAFTYAVRWNAWWYFPKTYFVGPQGPCEPLAFYKTLLIATIILLYQLFSTMIKVHRIYTFHHRIYLFIYYDYHYYFNNSTIE